MRKDTLIYFILLLVCIIGRILLQPHMSFAYNETFRQLSEKLETQNPHILMKYYNSRASKARQYGDFLLPDLNTSYMLMPNMDGASSISISQLIPFPTKIFLQSGYLKDNYKVSLSELQEAKIQVYYLFKQNYLQYYFLYQKGTILKLHKEILEQIESQVVNQVSAAKIPTSRLLFIQIEKIKLIDEIKQNDSLKKSIVNNIDALFNGQLNRAELIQSFINVKLKEYSIKELDQEVLIKESASYKMASYELSGLEYKRSLQYHRFFPDFMVGSRYDIHPGNTGLDDNLQVSLSLALPLSVFKRTGEINKVRNKVLAGEQYLDTIYNTQKQEIRNSIENYYKNKESYLLHKDTLKELVKQNFQEMQVSYITGKDTSSVDFLDAFRKLLDNDLTALKYQIEMQKELISIERITSRKIDVLAGEKNVK